MLFRIAASNGFQMRRGLIAVMALMVSATGARGDDAHGDSMRNLGSQVEDFLRQWITKQDPDGAVERHLSAQVGRDDFLPTEPGTVRRYPRRGNKASVRMNVFHAS